LSSTDRASSEAARNGRVRAAGAGPAAPAAAVEGWRLAWRSLALEGVRRLYPLGTGLGAAVLLACGGVVPVLRRWLRDELNLSDGRAVVAALGGVWLGNEHGDPDTDLGPVLSRSEAPVLFDELAELARRLGARPPAQTRLTYLPCCGAVAWGRRGRALLLGLPLLPVLTRGELRAVLAHELAHLARGDAVRGVRVAQFVEGLGRRLDAQTGDPAAWPRRSPLRAWARWSHAAALRLHAPIARGQEARADRAAAVLAGGDAAASALVKVALVQPLFREVLAHYDPQDDGLPNLYAFFREFWARLPEPTRTALRHRLLADRRAAPDPAHPDLIDRLAAVQAHPPRRDPEAMRPATTVLGDLDACEARLHARLFGTGRIEPSVFHRAGS
jgi:Zn-dependent protease with chaperone function